MPKRKPKSQSTILYYAVIQGSYPGIYDSWEACQEAMSGAFAHKFSSRAEAETFMRKNYR